MKELEPKEGELLNKDNAFLHKAVNAFEKTYTALFTQALHEVDSLNRVNSALALLQEELLQPDRIASMDTQQKIALLEVLTRSSQSNISSLSKFANIFNDVRTVVGTYDTIEKFKKIK